MGRRETPPPQDKAGRPAPEPPRDVRLKAALKANMARRKAQAKARAEAAKAEPKDG